MQQIWTCSIHTTESLLLKTKLDQQIYTSPESKLNQTNYNSNSYLIIHPFLYDLFV